MEIASSRAQEGMLFIFTFFSLFVPTFSQMGFTQKTNVAVLKQVYTKLLLPFDLFQGKCGEEALHVSSSSSGKRSTYQPAGPSRMQVKWIFYFECW